MRPSQTPYGYNIQGMYRGSNQGEVIVFPGAKFKVVEVNKNVEYAGMGKVTEYVIDFVDEKKFKPLEPSEAPKVTTTNHYSSLERLIKGQRDTDVRNGKQWRKYLIGQDMSQAEMKITGVWDELEDNLDNVVSKGSLLSRISDKLVFGHKLEMQLLTSNKKVTTSEWI